MLDAQPKEKIDPPARDEDYSTAESDSNEESSSMSQSLIDPVVVPVRSTSCKVLSVPTSAQRHVSSKPSTSCRPTTTPTQTPTPTPIPAEKRKRTKVSHRRPTDVDEEYMTEWLKHQAKRDQKLELEIEVLQEQRDVLGLQKILLKNLLEDPQAQATAAMSFGLSPIAGAFSFAMNSTTNNFSS